MIRRKDESDEIDNSGDGDRLGWIDPLNPTEEQIKYMNKKADWLDKQDEAIENGTLPIGEAVIDTKPYERNYILELLARAYGWDNTDSTDSSEDRSEGDIDIGGPSDSSTEDSEEEPLSSTTEEEDKISTPNSD